MVIAARTRPAQRIVSEAKLRERRQRQENLLKKRKDCPLCTAGRPGVHVALHIRLEQAEQDSQQAQLNASAD